MKRKPIFTTCIIVKGFCMRIVIIGDHSVFKGLSKSIKVGTCCSYLEPARIFMCVFCIMPLLADKNVDN